MLLALEVGGTEVAMLGFRQRLLDTMGVPSPPAGTRQASGPLEPLSDRERTVLRLLRGTLTNPQIAAALEISPNTLKTHLRHIYAKLNAANRRGAVENARARRLL
jgi:LuxR family maltose regulon positive regulatory protein